jgi:hypothetical protein
VRRPNVAGRRRYFPIIHLSQNLHLLVLQPPKPNLKSTPTRTTHTPPLVLPRPRIVHVPRRGCGHCLVVSLGQSFFLRSRLFKIFFALVSLKRHDTLDPSSTAAALIVILVSIPPDPRPSSSVTVPRRSLQRPSSELFVPPSPEDHKLDIAPELLLESCQAPSKSPLRAQRRSRYVCSLGGALLMSLISAAIMSPTVLLNGRCIQRSTRC